MKQTVSLILIVTLAVAVPLRAHGGQADSSHNWANVQTLRPGTKIIVEASDRAMYVATSFPTTDPR